MKAIFTAFFLFFIAFNSTAQSSLSVDSVDICGSKFLLPAELKLTSPQQLTAPSYSISWIFANKAADLDKTAQRIISSVSREFKNFQQQPLNCLFLYRPCKAYGLTYTDTQGNFTGQILVTSTIHNQPVYLQIQLFNPVFENEKLPIFINRILVLDR